MALVMLPCDLPWWGSVQKQLKKLANTKNTLELIDGMQKIHDMCNISLDPDEDTPDPHQFVGLLNFLDNDLTSEERSNFLNQTLPSMATRASNLRQHKPKSGLHFSLQQQPDCTELEYELAASLVANAFFSTYPKRTNKTHPTLQNFNFSYFFKNLVTNSQKAKLKSILHYFDWLSLDENAKGKMKLSRQVMSSKEWLTIEDWLECNLPLCPILIKHEGKLERTDKESLSVCFSSTKPGGRILENGNTQESMCMACVPELLAIMLHVESLEDNEVVTVEKVRRVSRIVDPKNRATLEKLREAEEITMCCVDAEDYSKLPLSQYEEDNVLRELNKCLLAYQQKQSVREQSPILQQQQQHNKTRRLSPIGESISLGSNSDQPPSNLPIITQESCSTTRSGSASPRFDNNNYTNNNKLRVQLEFERGLQNKANTDVVNNRRGRFIVLGSSGECLPVKRNPMLRAASRYSSCSSSDEEFHSAKTSVEDESEEEEFHKRYSLDLQTPERRHTFAERLKDALRREASSMSTSTESSYAVGINVTGSGVADPDIKVKRKGSTGFMLQEDSLDEEFLVDSLKQEKQWIDKFRNKQSAVLSRKESNKSSEYSFSTDYSSELEEVYEQFSRWLEDPILQTDKGAKKHLDGRDLAVVQFAGSILKRTLSESFAGVPLVDGDSAPSTNVGEYSNVTKKNKMVLSAKSLSLELAKHKHLLAAQLLSQIAQKPKNGLRSISTGNWGCGSSKKGEVQLKVIIQWLAASVSGVPSIIYYTSGHGELASLDTVYRILRDRKWTVKDLADATLKYSARMIEGRNENSTLFEELIGVDRNSTNDKRNQ